MNTDISMDATPIDRTTKLMLKGAGPDSILEISALSRPLKLGMLYNALDDQLIPGFTLWNTEDINSKRCVTPQPTTRFIVHTSETLNQKTSLLDVSASVKLSFFCGLLEAGGSAKYLSEKTSSTHQCRVTMNYHVTTTFEQLMLSELEAPKSEVFDKTDATHVVCAVIYGANALMEFQETVSDASSKQEIEGNLNVMIKKIPTIEISGDGSLKIDDEEKKKVQNMSCKFYGDFKLEKIPSTFEEAVKTYKDLPSLLGDNGENAVPVKVWLCPLSKLCSIESKLKARISELLVSKLENVMDAFHQAEVRSSDLLVSSKAIKAEDLICKLEQFQSSLKVFSIEFLSKMANLIPKIREGKVKEEALIELLKSLDASGFKGKEMEQWLGGKETEINIITKNITKIIKTQDCKVKSPGTELDSFLMDPDVSDAFVFSFTSLSYEEPYLNKISQAAENFKSGPTSSIPEQETKMKDPWYERPGVMEALRSSSKVFKNVPSDKVISFISDPDHPGASVRLYQNAILKNPHVTSNPIYLYARELTLDQNTVSNYLVLSEGGKKVRYVTEAQDYPDLPQRFDYHAQVLCTEPLTGRSYWECEWDGQEFCIGIAYESMGRKGSGVDSCLGCNDKSWLLWARNAQNNVVMYNNIETTIPEPCLGTRRIGAYLDREGGVLSFYYIYSDKPKLCYTFKTQFTDEDIYAAFWFRNSQMSLCKII